MSEYMNNGCGTFAITPTHRIKEERSKGRITTLIYLSKAGDTKANERLLREFTPTIEMLARDICRQWKPDADITRALKVANEAFNYAVLSYDHERTFEAYMKVRVIGELSKFVTQ